MRTTGAWWLPLGLRDHHYFVLLKMFGVGAGFTCHLVRVKISEPVFISTLCRVLELKSSGLTTKCP